MDARGYQMISGSYTSLYMDGLPEKRNPNVSSLLACFDSWHQESGWTAASGIPESAPGGGKA